MNIILIQALIFSIFCKNFALGDTSEKEIITNEQLFPLSIIHINDFHARFEETNEGGTSCKSDEKCIGGYARAVTVIKELKSVRANPIYLNAGDNFQGTLWYSIGEWNVTSQFLNMLNADAVTLGNHEFDRGIDGVVPFMEHLHSPVVVANIDDSDEPSFQGKYQKSIIIDRYDRKIGIIGVILNTTNDIANTEKLRFYNESDVIRQEATLLKEKGVDIIIVLSHCGLDVDYKIAHETAPLVDVIVGGHSHTFMYTVENGKFAPGPDTVRDVYPAVVETDNGHKTLIVQASAYMKYVGDLIVYFDNDGKVAKWQGAPIYLDNYIQPDAEILAAIQPWKVIIDNISIQTVGVSRVPLHQPSCSQGECNIGNFIADAYVHYYVSNFIGRETIWHDSIIAFINGGGIRSTINPGSILYGDLVTTIPFENSVDVFDLRGDHIKGVFEHAAKNNFQLLTQVSGLRIVYNTTKESPNRVESMEVLSFTNDFPQYEPLDLTKYYRCITSSFTAEGGDAFYMIPNNMKNHTKGLIDIDVVMQYLKDKKIIYTGLENRIKFVN